MKVYISLLMWNFATTRTASFYVYEFMVANDDRKYDYSINISSMDLLEKCTLWDLIEIFAVNRFFS